MSGSITILRRFSGYAAAIDPRIAAVSVVLEMHTDHARDDVEFFPRIFDVVDNTGTHLDLRGKPLGMLGQLAWDVVEQQTQIKDRADAYRVQVRPAVVAIRCEAADL